MISRFTYHLKSKLLTRSHHPDLPQRCNGTPTNSLNETGTEPDRSYISSAQAVNDVAPMAIQLHSNSCNPLPSELRHHSTSATCQEPTFCESAEVPQAPNSSQCNHVQHDFDQPIQLCDIPRVMVGEVLSSIPSQTGNRNTALMIPQDPLSTTSPQQGHFVGAHNFVMSNPVLNDITHIDQYNYFVSGQIVLDRLRSAGTPEAGLEAAARYPLPRCHPGTRKTIQDQLLKWLLDKLPKHKIIWMFGPAGVGKSAVAQTFAESAKVQGLLAATYFFSGVQGEKRSDPLRVVPTLAYQLAIHSRQYQHVVSQKLISDPSILDATLEAQFRGLIEEPFLQLASYSAQLFGGDSHVIAIDGLDECSDDEAQCKLVELIREVAQKTRIPLIWLISSRPERHLKSTFSRLEYVHFCRREELVIDNEVRTDVEQFLRARFREIHHKYCYMISVDAGSSWPAEETFQLITGVVDGHFVVASVAEKFVGDPVARNPEAQLAALVGMLKGLKSAGVSNPLEALDAFYSRILTRVADHAWSVVVQVFGLCAHNLDRIEYYDKDTTLTGTKQLWLFLQTDQAQFYSAMEALHSVLDIPLPKEAPNKRLTFYHKSFPDYLTNEWRSGKFFVSKERSLQYQLTCTLRWYNLILQFENQDRVTADEWCHAASMLREWFRGDFDEKALNDFKYQVTRNYDLYVVSEGTAFDSVFFNMFHEFNFNLILDSNFESFSNRNVLPMFAIQLTRDGKAKPDFVRTAVRDNVIDPKLLQHLSLLTCGKPIEPLDLTALDPFEEMEDKSVRYVIVGNGLKSGLACICRDFGFFEWMTIWLNTALPPTKNQKFLYQSWEQWGSRDYRA